MLLSVHALLFFWSNWQTVFDLKFMFWRLKQSQSLIYCWILDLQEGLNASFADCNKAISALNIDKLSATNSFALTKKSVGVCYFVAAVRAPVRCITFSSGRQNSGQHLVLPVAPEQTLKSCCISLLTGGPVDGCRLWSNFSDNDVTLVGELKMLLRRPIASLSCSLSCHVSIIMRDDRSSVALLLFC